MPSFPTRVPGHIVPAPAVQTNLMTVPLARLNSETGHYEMFDASGGWFRPLPGYTQQVDKSIAKHFVKIGGDWLNPKAFVLIEYLRGKVFCHTPERTFTYQIGKDTAVLNRLVADGGLTQIVSRKWVNLGKAMFYSVELGCLYFKSNRRNYLKPDAGFRPALLKYMEQNWVRHEDHGGPGKPYNYNPRYAAILTDRKYVTWNNGVLTSLEKLSKPDQKRILESVPWVAVEASAYRRTETDYEVNPEHVTTLGDWLMTLDGPWERLHITKQYAGRVRAAMDKLR